MPLVNLGPERLNVPNLERKLCAFSVMLSVCPCGTRTTIEQCKLSQGIREGEANDKGQHGQVQHEKTAFGDSPTLVLLPPNSVSHHLPQKSIFPVPVPNPSEMPINT